MKIKIFQLESELRYKQVKRIDIKPVGYLKHIKRSHVYSEILNSNGKKKSYFSPDKCLDILAGNLKEREKHVRLFDTNFNTHLSRNNSIIFCNLDTDLYYVYYEGKWYVEFSLDKIKSRYRKLQTCFINFYH